MWHQEITRFLAGGALQGQGQPEATGWVLPGRWLPHFLAQRQDHEGYACRRWDDYCRLGENANRAGDSHLHHLGQRHHRHQRLHRHRRRPRHGEGPQQDWHLRAAEMGYRLGQGSIEEAKTARIGHSRQGKLRKCSPRSSRNFRPQLNGIWSGMCHTEEATCPLDLQELESRPSLRPLLAPSTWISASWTCQDTYCAKMLMISSDCKRPYSRDIHQL